MSDTLVLISGDAPSAPMAWARLDGAGTVLSQGEVGAAPPPAATPARTVLVLPAADARLARLELPARSQAQARAGAAMMLKASMAGAEAMHFAVGAPQDAAGSRLVVAISAARLTEWLQRCAEFGADPHTVVLDCTAWPAPENTVTVVVTANRAIIAAGPLGGFSIEPALAPPLLARWLAEAGAEGARFRVLGGDAAPYRDALRGALDTAPLPDPVVTIAEAAAELGDYAPNLRQGEFAPAGRETQPFKLWRFAALLLVAAVMLQVGSLVISGWRDQQAAAQILAAAERDFRAARPEVRRIVNFRAQANALANAMQQAGRHPVIVVAEPLIQTLRQQPLARVDEVRHEGPSRTVRVIVSAPQPAQLEAFIAHLREQIAAVESRSIQPREGRYATELTVEAP